jgi:hypothetical protein
MTDQPICSDPVFIIGSPRSGTTILAWSLAKHSKLWTSGESYFLFDFFGEGRAEATYRHAWELSESSWLRAQSVSQKEFLEAIGLGIDALFYSRSGRKRWIDHTPHYALMADLLADMFPRARFLHIVRDGRRVVHSMQNFLNLFKGQPNRCALIETGKVARWATDFRTACRTWREYTEAAMLFTINFPDRCLMVRNEELEANPRAAFGQIFEFLDLPDEDGPTNYAQSTRLNSSFAAAPKEISAVAIAPNPWHEWTPEQRSIFSEEAAPILAQCGYDHPTDL